MSSLRIGLLGCGNIGQFLLEAINKQNKAGNGKIVAVYSRNREKTEEIAAQYDAKALCSFDFFLKEEFDVIVEATTVEFTKKVLPEIVHEGKDVIISSIGVFGDTRFTDGIIHACDVSDANVYVPSGAIGGLDIIRSANIVGELESVQITTRKPPIALGYDEDVTKEVEVFNGSAEEAIKQFPRNINVAIALSIAGLGPKRTKVRIVADPSITKNTHSIEANGAYGEHTIHIINEAMPNNPKTSYLAALSVLASITAREHCLQIG